MFSKRIVVSFILIGCLVHFIKTENTKSNPRSLNKQQTSKNVQNSKNPPAAQRRELLSNPNEDSKVKGKDKNLTKPEGKLPDSKGKDNGKSPVNSAGKALKPNNKKPVASDEKDDDNRDDDREEEKTPGRFRRIFGRINNFRKKICPIRFFGRLIKKSIGSNKPKPTDEEEAEP